MFVPAISPTIAFNFLIAGEWPGTKPVFRGRGQRRVGNGVIILDRRQANLLPGRSPFERRLVSAKVFDFSELQ